MFENMELPINKFYKNMFKHSKLKLHKCGDCDYRGTAACDLKTVRVETQRNTKAESSSTKGNIQIPDNRAKHY